MGGGHVIQREREIDLGKVKRERKEERRREEREGEREDNDNVGGRLAGGVR